jgi:hypothetical protein
VLKQPSAEIPPQGGRKGGGRLAGIIREAKERTGKTLNELTVFKADKDPYRIDTPANRRDAQWFADGLAEHGIEERSPLHMRGTHYRFLGRLTPGGMVYAGEQRYWSWLGLIGRAARWLGLTSFRAIPDERNEPPAIADPEEFRYEPLQPFVAAVGRPELVETRGIGFEPAALFPRERSPYRLAVYGEKASLRLILGRLAEQYHADLYTPAGEISNSHLEELARSAVDDVRHLVVIALTDSDPSGNQMAVSISHKLRALRDLSYPDLSFDVHAIGLTPDQVKQFVQRGTPLPQTPLKDSEKRADKWVAATGTEQVEIDALIALYPDYLRDMVDEALRPFFDATLAERTEEAQQAWREEATRRLAAVTASDATLAALKGQAEAEAAALAVQAQRAQEAFDAFAGHVATLEVNFPDYTPPQPKIDYARQPAPLIYSEMPFEEHVAILRARKAFWGDEE